METMELRLEERSKVHFRKVGGFFEIATSATVLAIHWQDNGSHVISLLVNEKDEMQFRCIGIVNGELHWRKLHDWGQGQRILPGEKSYEISPA